MKLSDCSLEYGVVQDANDPKKMGRIKAVVPGKFDNSSMKVEDMLWCMPLTTAGHQRVSKPMEGQKIWILHDKNNEYEYWYLPAWETNTNTAVAQQDDDYDVLVSREGKGLGAQQYYSGKQGFVTRIGNNASFEINQAEEIVAQSNGAQLATKGGQCFIGKTNDVTHPAVLGDKLFQLLGDLSASLAQLQQYAMNSWTTSHLVPAIQQCRDAIDNTNREIQSNNVFVSK